MKSSASLAPIRPDHPDLDDAWRPGAWLVRPNGTPSRSVWLEVSVLVFVVVYNVVGNLWLLPWMYVPVNLAAGAAMVALALKSGATWAMLGLAWRRVPRGIAVGAVAVAVVATGIALGVALPGTRPLFDDARVAAASSWQLIYQPLLRIPIGTAVFEELVFRGVLLGMFLRCMSPLRAATSSSVLFGLWHVLPTGLTIDNNGAFGGLAATNSGLALAIVGGVLGTWLVGYLFCWLRLRANSVVAPILLHAATNSLTYLGAVVVVRMI
jgi:membrane protease YdiL (CAAX protease family)